VILLRLFLLSRGLLLLSLLSLLPLALVPLIRASESESPESILLLLRSLNRALLHGALSGDGVDLKEGADGEDLLGLLDLLSRGVTFLRSLGFAREQDELALVLVQAGDVLLERLDRGVLTAVVDGDTDGQRELAGDLGLLWMCEQDVWGSEGRR